MILAVIIDLEGPLVETDERKSLFYACAVVELSPEDDPATLPLIVAQVISNHRHEDEVNPLA
jgi:hypothetical protein